MGNEDSSKPYVRDKALNKANNERTGESIRPDPFDNLSDEDKHQIVGGPASAKNVSPNTPKADET